MNPPVLPRPYPEDRLGPLTDEQWRAIPAQWVPTGALIPTQEGVSMEALSRLARGGEREGGDWAGRAVVWHGRLYLHDGHTAWVIACMRKDWDFPVRIVDVEGNPVVWRGC